MKKSIIENRQTFHVGDRVASNLPYDDFSGIVTEVNLLYNVYTYVVKSGDRFKIYYNDSSLDLVK